MEKIKLFLCVAMLIAGAHLSSENLLLAQTKNPASADTTKKEQIDQARLKLPDVIIYGKDRAVRKAGEKLSPHKDEAKIVKPESDYQYFRGKKFINQKDQLSSSKDGSGSQKLFRLGYGRFNQFIAEAGWLKETKSYNFALRGNFSRGDGQYENSQFNRGSFKAQVAGQLKSNLVIRSRGEFDYIDFGLYGAEISDLQRTVRTSKLNITAQWFGDRNQAAEVGVYFQGTGFEDRAPNMATTDVRETDVAVAAQYGIQWGAANLSIKANWAGNTLDGDAFNASVSQSYLTIRPRISFAPGRMLSFKAGVDFENLTADTVFSEHQFSPAAELIITPLHNLGFQLSAGKEYVPLIYSHWWGINPFIAQQLNPQPMAKDVQLKAGIEFRPIAKLTLKTDFVLQNWKHYVYWLRDNSGLFRLNRLERADLSTLSFRVDFDITSRLKLNSAVQLLFYSLEDDSIDVDTPNLPYAEKIRMPIALEYEINKTTFASLRFLWIGPRKISLLNDEELSGYSLLSLHFQTRFFRNYSLFVRGNNLLDQKYEPWQNYPAMGVYFEAGVQAAW